MNLRRAPYCLLTSMNFSVSTRSIASPFKLSSSYQVQLQLQHTITEWIQTFLNFNLNFYTHTQKINCLPLLFLNNIFLTQNGFLFLFIYYSMWQYKHHMTWYDFYLYFYFNHVSIFYPLLNDNHYFYIIPKFYGLNWCN